MIILNTLGQQQITNHIAAWAKVPVSLTKNSPISYANGAGLDINTRLSTFAGEVRQHEARLLETLDVSQGFLDAFLNKSNQYRLLFLQLPLEWRNVEGPASGLILRDMESLGLSLRRLEKKLEGRAEEDFGDEVEGPLSVGREVTFLRRFLTARASLAEEVQGLLTSEPAVAMEVYFDDSIRILRGFDQSALSLETYFSRRPSYRPPASI